MKSPSRVPLFYPGAIACVQPRIMPRVTCVSQVLGFLLGLCRFCTGFEVSVAFPDTHHLSASAQNRKGSCAMRAEGRRRSRAG